MFNRCFLKPIRVVESQKTTKFWKVSICLKVAFRTDTHGAQATQ